MTVYLVGAGPGDPGLLTVRGAELLRAADAVVHDRLAEASLLDLAPPTAARFDVGKEVGGPVQQEQINELLVDLGRRHATVVRLKGGDPFVFGRGGEEALALIAAGVEFEVVPGITSAIAVPAYAGVPVTHRGLSTSITVVTGHRRHGNETDTNWEALAAAGGTIVVLMGVAHRAAIAERLMAGGLAPDTPVAAVHWGTRSAQRTVRTTLADLGGTPLDPPVTIVIGAVAGLDLAWFERRPLLGRRIVVTRAREQASMLTDRLRRLGAEVVELPTIAIADPADGGAALRAAAAAVRSYDWVVLTSVNGVERLFAELRDARALGDVRVAAIGPGTADALRRHGVVADLVPGRNVAEGLLDAFADGPGRVLLAQAAAARDVLADGLRNRGWGVDAVEAYRTVVAEREGDATAAAAAADAITFTAGSTVRHYVDAVGRDAVPPCVVCIGPVTADAARDAGLRVDAVAEPHTIDGLVAAVVAALSP